TSTIPPAAARPCRAVVGALAARVACHAETELARPATARRASAKAASATARSSGRTPRCSAFGVLPFTPLAIDGPPPAPVSTSSDPFTAARDSQPGLAGQQVGRSENSQRAAGNETHKVQGQVEAVKGESSADRGTARYLVSGDPDLADHYPAWLDNLADDVTVEGSMLDGVVQGAEAARAIVVGIRPLYGDSREFH